MPLDVFKGVSKAMLPMVAKKIGKDEFLRQLQEAWAPVVPKNADIGTEVKTAWRRIEASGFRKAFDAVGITEADVRQVLVNIQENKPLPVRVQVLPGRNAPCTCGSGRKFKKCCGR